MQGRCNSCLLEAITFGGYPTLECMHEGEGCDKCITVCELEHDVSFFVHTHAFRSIYTVSQFLLFYIILFLSSAFTINYVISYTAS